MMSAIEIQKLEINGKLKFLPIFIEAKNELTEIDVHAMYTSNM